MNNFELNSLAEGVREQGQNPNGTMKDLVYDPISGEFKQVERGSHTNTGEVVTEMTEKGFA